MLKIFARFVIFNVNALVQGPSSQNYQPEYLLSHVNNKYSIHYNQSMKYIFNCQKMQRSLFENHIYSI